MASCILSLSNLMAIPCLIKTTNSNHQLMIYGIMFSSSLMHLTESKHQLQPLIFPQYSNLFLWIDRIVAILGIVYFAPILFTKNIKTIQKIGILGGVGLLASFLGEQKSNNWYYNYVIGRAHV